MSRFNELINSEKPLLVDFFSESCEPCKKMESILKEVALKVGNTATVIKVDVKKNYLTAGLFGVQFVPTVIVFKKGEIQWRQSGLVSAGKLVDILGILV